MIKKAFFIFLLSVSTITHGMNDLKQAGLIVGLSTAASIAFGIAHANVVTHISPEFFQLEQGNVRLRLGDPKSFTVYDLGSIGVGVWGFRTSWWVGAGLGTFAAIAARAGTGAKLNVQEVAVPLAIATAGCAVGSLLGYDCGKTASEDQINNSRGMKFLADRYGSRKISQEREKRRALYIAQCMSGNAYTFGLMGGATTIAWILAHRALKAYG